MSETREPELAPVDNTAEPLLVEVIAEPVPNVAVDPAIVEHLDRLQHPATSWTKSLSVLLISFAAFMSLGMLDAPGRDLVLIIVVLLVHEAGHYLGMRLFGYRNVRMFFIPLFGAAVSGRNAGVAGWKEAIVILLGPLPGLVVAAVLGTAWAVTRNELLARSALMFAVINAFNLLPVMPLDGGRLLQILFFVRNRYVESVVNVLAAAALAWIAFSLQAWILYLPAGMLFFSTGYGFRVSTVAQELKRGLPSLMQVAADEIPSPAIALLLDRVREHFPAVTGAQRQARVMLHIWDKLHTHPPGAAATVLLFLVYAASLAAIFIVPLVLLLAAGRFR